MLEKSKVKLQTLRGDLAREAFALPATIKLLL
jgi:hypothetical protein